MVRSFYSAGWVPCDLIGVAYGTRCMRATALAYCASSWPVWVWLSIWVRWIYSCYTIPLVGWGRDTTPHFHILLLNWYQSYALDTFTVQNLNSKRRLAVGLYSNSNEVWRKLVYSISIWLISDDSHYFYNLCSKSELSQLFHWFLLLSYTS